MNRRDSLLAAFVALLWGFNFTVIDWGMGTVPPLLFAAVRFAVVCLPALLVARPAAPWWKVALVGAFMSLGQFGFLYTALAVGMPAGLASLVLQAQVPLTIVIAGAALRERPAVAQVAGVLLGAAGLAVVGAGQGGHVPFGALLLCLGAALSWACGNAVARALKVPGGFGLTVWSALVVPVPLLCLAFAVNGPGGVAAGLAAFGWKAAVSTGYTAGLCSLVGYAAWNGLLARYPSGAVVPWVLLVPPAGIVSAWLCLGERPDTAELAGGAVLIAGVLVAQGIIRFPSRRLPGGERPGGGGPGQCARREPGRIGAGAREGEA